MSLENLQLENIETGRPSDRQDERTEFDTWRLLHIEADEVDALKVTLGLRYEMPMGSKIDHVGDFQEAGVLLQQQQYDAVLLGLACVSGQDFESLQQFIAEYHETPVLVLSGDESPSIAMKAGRCGAKAFLFKSSLTGELLSEALHKAIQGPDESKNRAIAERRKDPRYAIEAAAVIFPIQADGNPGREIAAITVDISQGGISLLAQENSEAVPDICLVGVECRDGVYRYATVEWRHRRLALPAVRFGGRFLRRTDDPFHETKLTPRFDPKELRYQPTMDGVVLGEWVSRGILQPEQVDRVKVCPHCESLLTFRDGCPQCGSPKTEESQLIHHFACAHVAPWADFSKEGLSCPKCCVQNLVVGADFEYLSGPHRCLECDWSDSETVLIAECMQCAHRFHGRDALDKDLFVYHVNRLDPLALIEHV